MGFFKKGILRTLDNWVHRFMRRYLLRDLRLANIVSNFQKKRLGKNIEVALHAMALESTAKYVQDHLLYTPAYRFREELWQEALAKTEKNNLFLEFGVANGKSINYFAEKVNFDLHGFDSFEGLPEDWFREGTKNKYTLNGEPPLVRENVKLHTGLFEKTLPEFLKKHVEPVAFLHVDCDLYSSTKTIFDQLKDRIQSGTVIIFDEYFNFPTWEKHEFKAFQEFIASTGKQYDYLGYLNSGATVAVKIK